MTLPDLKPGEDWWIALVDVQPLSHENNVIPRDMAGAVGWTAVIARDQTQAVERIKKAVEIDRVRVVSIEKHQMVFDIDEIRMVDNHLASNVAELNDGCVTVWGTLHSYHVVEGEA